MVGEAMYKQSQFAPGPAARRWAARAPTAGAIVRNKANFGASRIADKPFEGIELRQMYLPHQFGKTKPISGGQHTSSFRYPRPKPIVQNEANLPSHGRGRPSARPRALTLPPGTGTTAPNKPNSRQANKRGKCFTEKDLW